MCLYIYPANSNILLSLVCVFVVLCVCFFIYVVSSVVVGLVLVLFVRHTLAMDGVGGRRRLATKSSAEDQALDQIAKEVSKYLGRNPYRSIDNHLLNDLKSGGFFEQLPST
ncbi:hypothetical protein NQ317_019113 [Molorchus minor]|uniref:Uncharacterized protein n=1 Tax=Molorchus minor TaxID=1323400 RepID=A0ABQ9JLW4_9CUCU|nr:hypothetical protein NQ317_019113 [Molorchus minor]